MNKNKVRIGYQGMVGSYSEVAAKEFANKLIGVELVPLISSGKVVEALETRKIDYGVLAVSNNVGGIVEETHEAMKGVTLIKVDSIKLPIHHCLFRRAEDKPRAVVSHVQALKQTRKHMAKYNVEEVECKDTALAALMLARGDIQNSYVICSLDASMRAGLELVEKNIEDRVDNETTFVLFMLG